VLSILFDLECKLWGGGYTIERGYWESLGVFFGGASLWVMIDLNDLRSGRLSSMEYDDVLAVSLILFMFSTSTTDIRSW